MYDLILQNLCVTTRRRHTCFALVSGARRCLYESVSILPAFFYMSNSLGVFFFFFGTNVFSVVSQGLLLLSLCGAGGCSVAVSYTHSTLPTNREVLISGVVRNLKNKTNRQESRSQKSENVLHRILTRANNSTLLSRHRDVRRPV